MEEILVELLRVGFEAADFTAATAAYLNHVVGRRPKDGGSTPTPLYTPKKEEAEMEITVKNDNPMLKQLLTPELPIGVEIVHHSQIEGED